MDREDFMDLVYSELASDPDNNRANRIIDAADEYAESAQLGTNLAEVGTDTISRKQAIDALNEYFVRIGKLKRRGLNKGEKAISLDTVGAINSLPPAQPQHNEILYRHYKGGTYELVCNNVTHTETGESLVVYRDCRGQLWARPESMFYGLVNVGDDLVPRFVLCRSEGDAE